MGKAGKPFTLLKEKRFEVEEKDVISMDSRARWIIFGCLLFIGILATETVLAQEGVSTYLTREKHSAEELSSKSYDVVLVSALLMAILVMLSIKHPALKGRSSRKQEQLKKILFGGIVAVAVLSTLYLASVTVYVNTISATGGPVHWHVDYEVIYCGKQLDLVDPEGISNKVGTPKIHEHNDNRMHVEGTLVHLTDASYHSFFEIVGAIFDEKGFTYPTINGPVTLPFEGNCDGEKAELQGFLYYVENPEDAKEWVYTQRKIDYPFTEIMAPYSNVPPGDCLIIEFGPLKDKTDNLCASYEAAQYRSELHGR